MIKFLKQKNNQKGFSLVETLVALSIFTVSILALMSVLGDGISDTNYAKTKIEASYLAQDGIEYIRNMRDNNVLFTDVTGLTWNDFVKADKTYDSPLPSFTRTITTETISADEEKISCTVSWNQGSGLHSVTLTEYLFNWVE